MFFLHISWGWLPERPFVFSLIRHGSADSELKHDGGMISEGLWRCSESYDSSASQGPTALSMEGESTGVDKVDLDRRLWPHSLLYFFKAMLLSASFYTQAWNHTAHICQRSNAHKRHARSLSPFIYCSGAARQGHGIYYGGKFLVLVSWINMDQI